MSSTTDESAEDLKKQATEEIEVLRAAASEAADGAADFIREHPIACVLGAVALGFLVGAYLKKGSS